MAIHKLGNFVLLLFIGTLFSFSNQAMAEQARWTKAIEVAFQSNNVDQRSTLSKKVEQVQLTIKGQCYVGQGTTQPTDTGIIKFCFRSSTASDNSSFCDQWDQVYQSAAMVTSSGSFCNWFYQNTGTYFIVVYFPPYALQWWNGASIHDRPTEVNITGDTISCDFHFVSGCRLLGRVTIPPTTRRHSQRLYLLDTCGLEILSTYCDTMGNFEFNCIPIGSYYIRAEDWDYVNHFYPDCEYANDAQRIRFDTPGQVINNISWSLYQNQDTASEPTLALTLVKPDTGGGIAAIRRYIGTGGFGFSSTSYGDTIGMQIKPNAKFFLGRVKNMYDPKTISISYYPGTFLRSNADTLILSPNQSRTIVLPFAAGERMEGQLPVYTSKNMEFEPVLVNQNSFKSLGGEPYVDSFGFFQMSVPVGQYSLWFVPFCNGYHREQGWGAFSKENVSINSGQITQLTQLQSVQRSASIQGTVQCSMDPLVACFDSLGRCVSMSGIMLYTYYKELTENRWRCFYFSQIYSPPYNVRYSINCLPTGRFTMALAEPPNNPGESHKISWFGGTSYYRTIVSLDDIASLDIPTYAGQVEITNPNQTLELSGFNSKNKHYRIFPAEIDAIAIRQLSTRCLRIQLSKPATKCTIRIFDVRGKLHINKVYKNTDKTFNLSIPRTYSDKMVICNLVIDERIYNQKLVITIFD